MAACRCRTPRLRASGLRYASGAKPRTPLGGDLPDSPFFRDRGQTPGRSPEPGPVPRGPEVRPHPSEFFCWDLSTPHKLGRILPEFASTTGSRARAGRPRGGERASDRRGGDQLPPRDAAASVAVVRRRLDARAAVQKRMRGGPRRQSSAGGPPPSCAVEREWPHPNTMPKSEAVPLRTPFCSHRSGGVRA